ncbi:MAG: ABC transporter substrate-binding protein [Planctomycetaceae bacterium]|nr:ABC transporter substrate-binding protein [Planctomycetaceae bacterium]
MKSNYLPWSWIQFGVATLSLGFLLLSIGCTSKSSSDSNSNASPKMPAVTIQFPDGDPSVPADLGGPGFTGEGWTTANPGAVGDPNAVKGGVISTSIPNWPDNLRRFGTGSNTWLNYLVRDLCYESLCNVDPMSLEIVPGLASHWQISEDNLTFRFRIDPRAHWSDGSPVVAEDWAETYRLIDDDTLIDPMTKQTICGKMEAPKILSKYMLEVKCKEKSWRNFLSFAGMTPLPAHEINGMTGTEFLEKYNFAFTATSGPYLVRPADIKKNESLTITRRDDYWAKDKEANKGLYNFDKIRLVVIRDRRLGFDKACKGEIDFHPVFTAKWWVEDVTPLPAYENGQLIRSEIFTRYPKGFQGMAFNMREPPLNDARVRKAIAHLYDRKTLLKKFAYDQYDALKSYYPGSDAANPNNKMIEYDPATAVKLLSEAGWTERDGDGILTKDGKRLSFTIMYRSEAFEKYLTSVQESCRKVGVEVILTRVTPETLWKNMMERTFQVASMAWGATLYPNPISNWSTEMADQKGSNNITGFNNEKADGIIAKYDAEFEISKRTLLLRELDALIYDQVPYALDWYNPCERILYWNKFGMPAYGLPRYGEYESAFVYWWYDPQKADRLKATLKNGESMAPIPELQIRPWENDSMSNQATN